MIESGDFLNYVDAFLKRKRPTTFKATWMLLASYEKVEPFSGSGEVGTILTIMELCKPTV